jgi:hypothetical protein
MSHNCFRMRGCWFLQDCLRQRKFRSLNSVARNFWKILVRKKQPPTIHHHNNTSPEQYITKTIYHNNNTSPEQYITTIIHHNNNISPESPEQYITTSPQQYFTTTIHHKNNISQQQYITPSPHPHITTSHHITTSPQRSGIASSSDAWKGRNRTKLYVFSHKVHPSSDVGNLVCATGAVFARFLSDASCIARLNSGVQIAQ